MFEIPRLILVYLIGLIITSFFLTAFFLAWILRTYCILHYHESQSELDIIDEKQVYQKFANSTYVWDVNLNLYI